MKSHSERGSFRHRVGRFACALAVSTILIQLGGCAKHIRGAAGQVDNQSIGALSGAALGGFIGSKFGGDTAGTAAATAIGVILGGLAGRTLGSKLDEADQIEADQSTQAALESAPTGQAQSWVNPDTGSSGGTTPGQAFYDHLGRPCRPFEQLITVDGRSETIRGTACRRNDGTWEVAN